MVDVLAQIWPYFVAICNFAINLVASGHAVLYKRETRAAIGWVGLIWLVPLLGAALYVLLGINRIHRKAQALRKKRLPFEIAETNLPGSDAWIQEMLAFEGSYPSLNVTHYSSLVKLVDQVTRWPLLPGNHLTPYVNGDEAYPAMLQAIEQAEHSINLMTYIFDNDSSGRIFRDALQRAQRRGVEVRVLMDDVGARYSWPSMARLLHRAKIPVARFLPTTLPWRFRYSNLRNHRKIMVVDGKIGFTGGMNLREGNCLNLRTSHPIQDLHFRLDGPAVAHLQEIFVEDWTYTTGEDLRGGDWFPHIAACGNMLVRGISEGPDEDFDKLRLTILGALACAQSSVVVVTPYFLPDGSIITALKVAAMRGVDVDIVLPEKNNLALVQWASTASFWQLLECGCRIWLSPPPFDHTKLMLVDDIWALLGSANWDPRSLRLNFEFNVEAYDPVLTERLAALANGKIRRSIRVRYHDVEARPLPIKLRDGVARLFSPYL